MTSDSLIRSRPAYILLAFVAALHICLSIIGITWGLPTRAIDPFLFGSDAPWSGEEIARLTNASAKFSSMQGADVDPNPLPHTANEPICLTGTPEAVAEIYLRYRLYTYQPDEMITMRALAGIRPSELQFDPKLYQYGGLFIYPVGVLIKLSGMVGLIDVRSDLVYYLDHPDEFGKFYVVARAYSAAWGLVGAIVVFGIARRLGGSPWAGTFGALCFIMMPVVVCMTHEGKPHLPGAVLMLAAVLLAIRATESREATKPRGHGGESDEATTLDPSQRQGRARRSDEEGMSENAARSGSSRRFRVMCVLCGAAVAMVLSSWPILVLIPLVAWLNRHDRLRPVAGVSGLDSDPLVPSHVLASVPSLPRSLVLAIRPTIVGLAIAMIVYLATNPYVAINTFANREVLRSNFGNSFAMYHVDRIGEGLLRVLDLTIEGASLPVFVVGGVSALWVLAKRRRNAWPLLAPALLFFFQFVLIGAGKPGEYGRFGVFTNSALAIGAACAVVRRGRRVAWCHLIMGLVITGGLLLGSGLYLWGFFVDASGDGSRNRTAADLVRLIPPHEASDRFRLALVAEPAPYSCPPLPFKDMDVLLFPTMGHVRDAWREGAELSAALRTTDVHFPPGERESLYENDVTIDGAAVRYTFWPDIPEESRPVRTTPISWANKPIATFRRPPRPVGPIRP